MAATPRPLAGLTRRNLVRELGAGVTLLEGVQVHPTNRAAVAAALADAAGAAHDEEDPHGRSHR
jgi:hypothetical protein